MPPKQPRRGPPPGLRTSQNSSPLNFDSSPTAAEASSPGSDGTVSPLSPFGDLDEKPTNFADLPVEDAEPGTAGDGEGGRPSERGKAKGKERGGNNSGNSSLSNRTGMLAMSRKAFRGSMMMACHQTFGRLQVCSGQKKADALVARAQRGVKPGTKPVPISKHPCYIVQRTNPGSTSRSRFQITVAGSAGAKILAQKAMYAAYADLAPSELGTWQVEQKCANGDGNWWCFEPTHLGRCKADRVSSNAPREPMPTDTPDAIYAIQNCTVRLQKDKKTQPKTSRARGAAQPAKPKRAASGGTLEAQPKRARAPKGAAGKTPAGETPANACGYCGKRFRTASNLALHERVHAGEKPFPCSYCDKRFTRKQTANVHERIHTGEQRPSKHVCRHCGKQCRDNYVLGRHEMIHTGAKPFGCQFCDKRFRQKGNAATHERLHAGEQAPERGSPSSEFGGNGVEFGTPTEETLFSCAFCDWTFTDKKTATAHEMTHSALGLLLSAASVAGLD